MSNEFIFSVKPNFQQLSIYGFLSNQKRSHNSLLQSNPNLKSGPKLLLSPFISQFTPLAHTTMAPTTIPGWKRKLCIQKAHVKHAFFSEDMTYFHLRAALAHHNNSDPKAELASLLGDNDSTTDTLNNLNIGNTGTSF